MNETFVFAVNRTGKYALCWTPDPSFVLHYAPNPQVVVQQDWLRVNGVPIGSVAEAKEEEPEFNPDDCMWTVL